MKTRLRDGSGSRHYRYLKEDVDRHGNVRIYFRRGKSPKVRITATPGTDEFDREYQAAFRGTPSPSGREGLTTGRSGPTAIVAGTFRWLCQRYYASAYFQALDSSTKKNRRGTLAGICEDHGDKPFASMEPRHVAMLRDEKAALPGAANQRVGVLKMLFRWACSPEYQLASKNPAEKVGYLSPKSPDGFKAWTEEDLARYQERHPIGTKARLALDLLLYTGVRRSDVVRLGPQMERDGNLIFSEFKFRNKVKKQHRIPILPELRASIDATPDTDHLVYLVARYGKPYTVDGFSNWFKRQCRLAEIDPELSAHGLRKLGAIRCVENGATNQELMALFGWASAKQSDLYTRKANREVLEAKAAVLLGRKENQSGPPSDIIELNRPTGTKK